jgi:hypothetical protein
VVYVAVAVIGTRLVAVLGIIILTVLIYSGFQIVLSLILTPRWPTG